MIYQAEGGWYWTVAGFSRPVGPFKTEEEATVDYRNVMGMA